MSKPGWLIAVVALSISSSASLPADIPLSAAANKEVVRNYIDRIVDGKVVEMWHEMDLWGTLLMLDD